MCSRDDRGNVGNRGKSGNTSRKTEVGEDLGIMLFLTSSSGFKIKSELEPRWSSAFAMKASVRRRSCKSFGLGLAFLFFFLGGGEFRVKGFG